MNYGNTENWRYMMLLIRKIKYFGFAAVLFLASFSYGQNVKPKAEVLSLDTILNRIDQNNIQLQSYGLRAEAYQHKGEAVKSWMAPMVGAGTYMTPYPGAMTMGPADKGSLMFQIEQDIPDKVKQNAKRDAIQSLGDVEKASRGVSLNELKATAKQMYTSWLMAQKKISLLQENENIMLAMKKVEELRYTYNQSMLGNIYKVEALLEENKNVMISQEGEIGRARAVLNALMNMPVDYRFEVDSNYTPSLLLEVSYDTNSLADQRSDILKMDKSIESMKLEIEAMNLQKRPDLKIRFDHMSPLAKGGMPNSYSIMGMISIPIAPWSSKMYKKESKAMHYDVLAMEKEKEAMLNEAQGMLTGMHYEIKSMEKQIAGMENKVIPALKKSFDAYFINYQENKLELPFVLDAWEALLMMQMNVLDEKLKIYQIFIDYEKELYR